MVFALYMRFSLCVSDVTCKDKLCHGNVLRRLHLFSLQYPLTLQYVFQLLLMSCQCRICFIFKYTVFT